jgi:hypothetical protein
VIKKPGGDVMSYEDWLLADRDMNLRVRHELAEAESRRLARQVRRQPDQGLSWQLRWMMCGLGLKLVALGARIEGRFLPPAESAGRRVQ